MLHPNEVWYTHLRLNMWCISRIEHHSSKLRILLVVYSTIVCGTLLMTLPYFAQDYHIKGFMDIDKHRLESETRVVPLQSCWPVVNITGSAADTDCFYECLDRNTGISDNSGHRTSFVLDDKLNVSKLSEVPPRIPYLPNSRNPCFLSKSKNDTKLRCLPYFFLAGFPKTGTTDLYQRIRVHGFIQSPLRKEPHWWSNNNRKPFSNYLDQFLPSNDFQNITHHPDKTATTIFGDFSTREFLEENVTGHWDPRTSTLAAVKRILPCARFLVMLRNPVERLYSDYLYFSGRQYELKKDMGDINPRNFHIKCLAGIQWWRACLKQYRGNIRHCLHSTSTYIVGHPPLSSSHNKCWTQANFTCKAFRNGLYFHYINDWLQVFPKVQFMFLRLEDYAQNKIAVMNKVLRFLGTRYLNAEELRKVELMWRQVPGGAPLRITYPPMLPETRTMLQEFYRESNMKLSKLLGDDTYRW